MPGPAPNPNARRRNARVGVVQLPAEGRKGAAPKWPMGGEPPRGWAELWKKPQAVMWERMHVTDVVARYCLTLANPALWPEARQLEDRLGLSPKAMRSLMWEIVEDEVEQARTTTSTRRKLTVVADGAVAAD